MTVDAQKDEIGFTSYDGFLQAPGDTALVGLVKVGEGGIGGVSGLMKDSGNSYNRAGLNTTFKLSDYYIDIYHEGDQYYVPLQTMHDILLAHNYFYTVYNGEKVFVFAYGCALRDQIHSVKPAEMSETYAGFNYNELLFLLDSFYGLKSEHYIDSFEELILNTGLFEGLTSTDPVAFDKALSKLTGKYLDDLHSGYSDSSALSPVEEEGGEEDLEDSSAAFEDIGTSSSAGFTNMLSYGAERMKYNEDMNIFEEEEIYDYREVGDTAIITFDHFTAKKQDYYKEADLDNPQDTIELIASAHKQIMRENSPIKNVVLDLSNNGGGDADAAAFVIAWFTGSKQLGLRNTLTGAQSVVSYEADVNLDKEFGAEDSLVLGSFNHDLNLYCMTSPNSFSCGNLVPAVFKGAYGITLIGKASGGGSCVVLPCTSASGAQFQISGTSQISVIKNGSFYNADTGIEVDVPITSTETMYDREKLVEFIHGLK